MSGVNAQSLKKLPKGWEWAKLKDVCSKIIGGGTPSTKEPKFWNGDIPWISSADIEGLKEIYPRRKITREAIKMSTTNILPKGGIIVVTRVGLGKIAIAPFDICFSQDSQGLILDEKRITQSYALIYLSKSVQKLKHESRGTTINGVTKNQLIELDIPLPPLSEQERIASKLEELFSELDKSIEELKTAQQQLKVYRQAVLKWAFEGNLTNSKIEWNKIRLGDVAFAVDPQPSHRTPPKVENGVPYVSIKDFDSEQDKIDFSNARIVSSTVLDEHLERYKLEEGDFVIGKIGTIGKPVRIVLPQNYTLSANIVLIQPRKVDKSYLYYFFQSNFIEREFQDGAKATTQAAFGIQKVRELKIYLPSDIDQRRIVQEIESRLSVCDKIEETINNNLKQAETLRQSILKKTFEGKLI